MNFYNPEKGSFISFRKERKMAGNQHFDLFLSVFISFIENFHHLKHSFCLQMLSISTRLAFPELEASLANSKLKVFADNILLCLKWCNCFNRVKKHCGKLRKYWFPAFSLFVQCFKKGSFPGSLKVRIVH